jgi:hypothetical protein
MVKEGQRHQSHLPLLLKNAWQVLDSLEKGDVAEERQTVWCFSSQTGRSPFFWSIFFVASRDIWE